MDKQQYSEHRENYFKRLNTLKKEFTEIRTDYIREHSKFNEGDKVRITIRKDSTIEYVTGEIETVYIDVNNNISYTIKDLNGNNIFIDERVKINKL